MAASVRCMDFGSRRGGKGATDQVVPEDYVLKRRVRANQQRRRLARGVAMNL